MFSRQNSVDDFYDAIVADITVALGSYKMINFNRVVPGVARAIPGAAGEKLSLIALK